MGRSVQKGDDLNIISQAIVRQLLKLGRRQSMGLHQGWCALVLKMSLQLDGEAIDFEKCRLPDGPFQHIQMVQVMSVVPVNFAELQIRPVHNLTFGQPEVAVARFD